MSLSNLFDRIFKAHQQQEESRAGGAGSASSPDRSRAANGGCVNGSC
jgi:hypothetical protein